MKKSEGNGKIKNYSQEYVFTCFTQTTTTENIKIINENCELFPVYFRCEEKLCWQNISRDVHKLQSGWKDDFNFLKPDFQKFNIKKLILCSILMEHCCIRMI